MQKNGKCSNGLARHLRDRDRDRQRDRDRSERETDREIETKQQRERDRGRGRVWGVDGGLRKGVANDVAVVVL